MELKNIAIRIPNQRENLRIQSILLELTGVKWYCGEQGEAVGAEKIPKPFYKWPLYLVIDDKLEMKWYIPHGKEEDDLIIQEVKLDCTMYESSVLKPTIFTDERSPDIQVQGEL